MKIHPLCLLLPWMSEVDLLKLADDIKQHGQREPILIWRGQIIDGKNRFRACELAGIKPKFKEIDEDNPAALVRSLGIFRRHLTDSQRAMLAAELSGHANGRPAKPGPIGPASTKKRIAEELGVSEKQVKRAKTVLRHGAKSLKRAVQKGEVSVSAAAQVATLPKLEQRALAEAGPDAVRAKAAEMRVPWPEGPPPETKLVNGETKAPERETKPVGATVASILRHLDKWWAAEKKNLCSYPYCPPQRIWDLVRAEIVKVGA